MRALCSVMALAGLGSSAFPLTAAPTDAGPPSGSDQEVGKRFKLTPDSLPEPYATRAVNNSPLTVPFSGQALRAPDGFTVTAFATKLTHPRRLLVLPNGDVILAEQKPGWLTLLRDADGDGKAEYIERYAEGFTQPYGLAWRDGEILVADQVGIWRIPHKLTDVRSGHGEQKPAAEVPPDKRKPDPNANGQKLITARDVFGLISGHTNRDLKIDPRTGDLYVAVGSSGNIGEEPEVKATIQRFKADGSDQQTFASGTRNPCGLAFQPESGDLYAVVQERDGLGDDLVPDYLTKVQQGGFYGWPYAYTGPHPQPGFADRKPEKVKASITPDLLFQAHSAAMDLVFYEGDQFPKEFKGSALVVLKGSWNRSEPTGYKIVRVPFENGKPTGEYENFVAGWWASGDKRAEVWGRPAAIAQAKDGALLIADDTAGTIWRVAYTGPPTTSSTP
jgi:glucose/arabinose dehydrogenase